MTAAALVAALSYLDLAEIAVGAYDGARMEAYVREAETAGVQEHGFPRLAANLGQLVAAGRMSGRRAILERMLTVACSCAKRGPMPPKSGGNEFSVRELVSAVVALEKAGPFPPEKVAAWKADLAAVDARACYTSATCGLGQPEGRNWPLFGAASEQSRIRHGLGGDPKHVEAWVADQLRHFDRNGMYRDPHEPAVYDFIGRICYMATLHCGYGGPWRAKVEEELVASAEPTLAMLSVCGEIPYGGRSNQFLHNNTMYAALAEWYAAHFARRGDAERAARFRSAAARAVAALEPWVTGGRAFHVKNRFPAPETGGARNVGQKWFGCEDYAYFDKYMVTMGSWAVLAHEFSQGRPLPDPPAPPAPSTFATSEHFHWKFAQSRNYTVQEDWNANANYDATGIGRIHRRGAPPAICLSTPFAERPGYCIGVERNPGPLAIAAVGGKMTYEVSDWGVKIRVTEGTLTLPAFEFDGETETRVELGERLVKVSYRGWTCRYAVRGGTFVDTGLKYFNRNGRYRRVDCVGKGLEVFVTVEKEDRGTCICGVAPERADDFYWENDRVGFRAYGPGDFHKWSGIDLFVKNTPSNAVERLLREPGCHGNWHRNGNPQAYDDFAVGPGRGCGGVAIFADGEWKTYPNWETARVLHEGDDRLEFELVYPACCALGKMTYHVTMRKGDDFFHNDVSFEHPGRMGKGWIVRPEVQEDPQSSAKPFLRFAGDGTKPSFSYEAGFTISNAKGKE